MTKNEVLITYDEDYACRYNETYLLNPENQFLDKALFEIEFLKQLTREARSWLDVACGTGYFLKYGKGNSDIECMGIDISPAMLQEACKANPTSNFIEADFLQPQPNFTNHWDIVTCMGGAYCLQETIEDIETLIKNAYEWTSSGGVFFMSIFDLTVFEERRKRGKLLKGVELNLDKHKWTYIESDGKIHREMLAPPVSVMMSLFERYFESIKSFPYEEASGMIGVIAKKQV